MLELVFIGLLAWACYKSKAVDIAVRALLFVFGVIAIIYLLKVGFVAAFIMAVADVFVSFFKAIFGLASGLLFS